MRPWETECRLGRRFDPSHNITSIHKVPAIDDFYYFLSYFTTLYSLEAFPPTQAQRIFMSNFMDWRNYRIPFSTSTFSPRVVRLLKQFSMELFWGQCYPCPFVCCYKQTIGKLRSDSQHSMYGWIAKKGKRHGVRKETSPFMINALTGQFVVKCADARLSLLSVICCLFRTVGFLMIVNFGLVYGFVSISTHQVRLLDNSWSLIDFYTLNLSWPCLHNPCYNISLHLIRTSVWSFQSSLLPSICNSMLIRICNFRAHNSYSNFQCWSNVGNQKLMNHKIFCAFNETQPINNISKYRTPHMKN